MNTKFLIPVLVLAQLMLGCDSASEFASSSEAYSTHMTSFEQATVRKKVDIIFVVDNSTSMARDQANISVQFENFISSISNSDYRIGFINTDATAPNYENREGFQGNLKTVGENGEKYLDSNMRNLSSLFRRAILNQENSPCTALGVECDEEPMKALMMAIEKKDSSNAGFFRPGASFVPVIITDEDELSIGGSKATQPRTLLSYVKKHLQLPEEDITSFVIAIPPHDPACLAAQRRESVSGTGANYGTLVWSLAEISGGFPISICHPNFGAELRKMSKYLESRLLYQSILLDPPPAKASSIRVHVQSASGATIRTEWKLLGTNMLRLIPPPPEDSRVEIRYTRKNETLVKRLEEIR